MKTLKLESVSFSYDLSQTDIISNLNVSFSAGWTGLIGQNGCGKSTLLKILNRDLEATSGTIINRPDLITYCEQETLQAPRDYSNFCEAFEADALALRNMLGIQSLLDRQWHELSCGEQKRIQVAYALWRQPDLFLIDEPTNHVDAVNRKIIISALRQFKGIGIVVSHDRELLNTLCHHCLFLVGNNPKLYPGNFDDANALRAAELKAIDHQKDILDQKSETLRTELNRLGSLEQRSKKRLSKRNISHKDHDAKAKIDGARLTGKDASLGQKKINLANRLGKIESEIDSLSVVKDYSDSIFFNRKPRSSRTILHTEDTRVQLANGKTLHLPELTVRSSDKIGLIGPNGVGKTSFLEFIRNSGIIKSSNYYYLRQELDHSAIAELRLKFRDLASEDRARCLQIIARLGSDAKQVLGSVKFSSGETRKLAVALAIVCEVDLLVLDEPTNHLDLPSIQKLEHALGESELALMVVSHDTFFINAICDSQWEICKSENGDSILKT